MSPANAGRRPRLGPGRLSAEETENLPDRLMDSAFTLFTEHGFAEATMDQIAKRAGASTKTLYSRFANKSEILEAVVRRNVQRTVADHLKGFALRPGETEPREFLTKLGIQLGIANQAEETGGLVRVTFAESHRYPVLKRMYKEVTGRGINAIANALEIWREKGEIDYDAPTEDLAALCFHMISHEMRNRAVFGEPMSRGEITRYVTLAVDVFLKGIEPEAKPKKRTRK